MRGEVFESESIQAKLIRRQDIARRISSEKKR